MTTSYSLKQIQTLELEAVLARLKSLYSPGTLVKVAKKETPSLFVIPYGRIETSPDLRNPGDIVSLPNGSVCMIVDFSLYEKPNSLYSAKEEKKEDDADFSSSSNANRFRKCVVRMSFIHCESGKKYETHFASKLHASFEGHKNHGRFEDRFEVVLLHHAPTTTDKLEKSV